LGDFSKWVRAGKKKSGSGFLGEGKKFIIFRMDIPSNPKNQFPILSSASNPAGAPS
jgi:hypothetical protein